jgi:hypothetical protein
LAGGSIAGVYEVVEKRRRWWRLLRRRWWSPVAEA